MIINLDQWIRSESEADVDDRVFAHDIFISHRRFDLPRKFVSDLAEQGTHVIWDCDMDVRDRRVMHAIGNAMRRSRYVALFVSNNYVDSPWCAAEYLSALSIEERFNIPRALVILESSRAKDRVPRRMARQEQFLANGEGVAQLAAMVNVANRVDAENSQLAQLRRLPTNQLGPATELLSIEEHLNILEQRLTWWFESNAPPSNVSAQAQTSRELMFVMGSPYSEIEDIIREVRNCVLERHSPFKSRDGVDEAALRRVIAVANIVRSALLDPRTSCEAKATSEWLYDFLLKPLLLAVTFNSLRGEATSVYRALCSALATGPEAAKVPIYLRVLNTLLKRGGEVEIIVRQGTLWLIRDR